MISAVCPTTCLPLTLSSASLIFYKIGKKACWPSLLLARGQWTTRCSGELGQALGAGTLAEGGPGPWTSHEGLGNLSGMRGGGGGGAPSAVLAGLLAKTGLCRPRSGEGRTKGGEGALRSLNSGQGGLAAGPGDQDTPDATLGGSLSYAWIRGQEKRGWDQSRRPGARGRGAGELLDSSRCERKPGGARRARPARVLTSGSPLHGGGARAPAFLPPLQ